MKGNCSKCTVWREALHRDHINPRWNGGSDTPDNIQHLCANCHEDKTRAEFRSEVYREKVSARVKGTHWTEEQKAAQSARQLGKKWGPRKTHWNASEAQKEAQRASWTPERREAARLRVTGTKMGPCSEERKEKIRLANTGRVFSSEARANMSAAHKGKPRGQRQKVEESV